MKRNQDENINKKQVGRRIMAIRKRNFLTLIEFADKVGASKSSVSDWEKGFRLPEADILGIFRRVHNKFKFSGELEC